MSCACDPRIGKCKASPTGSIAILVATTKPRKHALNERCCKSIPKSGYETLDWKALQLLLLWCCVTGSVWITSHTTPHRACCHDHSCCVYSFCCDLCSEYPFHYEADCKMLTTFHWQVFPSMMSWWAELLLPLWSRRCPTLLSLRARL